MLLFPLWALLSASPVPGILSGHEDPQHTVLAARAAERAGREAEARTRYLAAADQLPVISDWLLRRVVLLSSDSAARATLWQRITSPTVRARRLETEALARERAGDLRGAAIRFDSIGRVIDATRLQLTLARSVAERNAQRRVLLTYLAQRAAVAEVESGIAVLLKAGPVPTPAEALELGRIAARARLASRAVAFFPRAFARRLGTAGDHLSHGKALAQLGRHREAITVFRRILRDSTAASEARYQLAVSQVRLGRRDAARAALDTLLAGAQVDSQVLPRVLMLAGDLAWRDADGETSRRRWLELAERYPRDEAANRAAFLAALVLWEQGQTAVAAAEWERLAAREPSGEGLAAGYWAGRAWSDLHDSDRARVHWQRVMSRDSLSYYAVASARKLGLAPWQPRAAAEEFSSYPELDSAAVRMELLRRLDLPEEAGWERDWLVASPRGDAEWLLATANTFRQQGQTSVAVSLTWRALRAGARRDARSYRLLYPISYEGDLRRHAAEHNIDPALVAALIRQESVWQPEARSRVGAMGLMQIMPATGRQIARGLKLRGWRPELLNDPAINLRIGIMYLAENLRRSEGDLVRTLAAYNAGPSRLKEWSVGLAGTDSDYLAERIAILETRNYVRVIQRNLAIYRALYGGPGR